MISSSGRYKIGPTGYPGALVITMATGEDAGLYTCVASNSYNEMDSYDISLQVFSKHSSCYHLSLSYAYPLVTPLP